MAAAGPPLVRVRMPGPHDTPSEWQARLTAWVRRGDGWHAHIAWREDADGAEATALLPAEYVGRVDGEEYGGVPRRDAERVERHGVWRYHRRPA